MVYGDIERGEKDGGGGGGTQGVERRAQIQMEDIRRRDREKEKHQQNRRANRSEQETMRDAITRTIPWIWGKQDDKVPRPPPRRIS